MSEVRTLVIDGKDVAASSNQSLLSAARENGIRIPTLCHLEGLSDIGACRLCMVEVEGSPKLFPACATAAEEGMRVTTNSERLIAYRSKIIELFFLERNHICAVCVANKHCELQNQAQDLGLTHFDFAPLHPELPVDATHERFILDHNRCILCTRCVHVCDEVEGAHTWDISGRGIGARLVSDGGTPWGSSTTCTSCGKCVQVCPTGALSEKGRSVAEAKARRPYLPYLVATHSRGTVNAGAAAYGAVTGNAMTGDAMLGNEGETMAKAKLATIWLDGCSGCHMSFLDIDERLLVLAERADLVYGCLVDAKEFPEGVDVTLVEGAVSSTEDLRKIREVRARSRLVVSLGDCAVTSNVPGMRNPFGPQAVLERAYLENVTLNPQIPSGAVPALLAESLPVHAYVPVDVFVPGCPPSADRIFEVVLGLLDGHIPDCVPPVRFG